MADAQDRLTAEDKEHLAKLEEALFEIRRVIAGQEGMLERLLVCLLAGGHLLIEGVPGLAKTLAIKSTASVLGGSFSRIQFTPDLVPSDLVGTRIFRPDKHEFETELGPVFCNFLLADEINRAPAKVQSALLEVMQERQVTIGHKTHPVPDPFLVLATQNPIESEGTYPLPEAQVDRFMLKVLVDYPAHDEELTVVARSLEPPAKLTPVLSIDELKALQAIVAQGVRRSRRSSAGSSTSRPRPASRPRPGSTSIAPYISYGASPRGPISVIAAARALAVLRQRDYVLPARRRGRRARRVPPPARPLLPGARGGGHRRPGARPGAGGDRTARRSTSAVRRRCGGVKGLVAAVRDGARPPPAPGPGAITAESLEALELAIGRRVDGLLAGDYRSAFAGVGTELYQVRPYEAGDDVRRIDWNVTARTGQTHVRVELAERVLVTWLVFDASASMAFGTADRRKADVAEGVALAIGHTATRRGNRLGLVAFGADDPRWRRPRQGRRGLLLTLAALREEPAGSGGLAEALALLDGLALQRSLVVDRLGLPRPDRLAQGAAAGRRPPSDARGRDPRSARAGARRRRRAAARRSRDGPAASRRHERPQAARAVRRRPQRRSAAGSCACSPRPASVTSRSRPKATGSASSRPSCRRSDAR